MRWFKKIVRAVLALLPLYAIFLIPSNASALQHNYSGLIPSYLILPNSNNEINPSSMSLLSNSFNIDFKGTAWQDQYQYLKPSINTWHLDTDAFTYVNNTCIPDPHGTMNFHSDLYLHNLNNPLYRSVSINTRNFVTDNFTLASGVSSCFKFDSSANYDMNDFPASSLQFTNYDQSRLSSLDAVNTLSTFYPPHLWSVNGLKMEANSQSGGGILYSHSFSLTKYFNMGIPTFSLLDIPLASKDGYFMTPENLYSGRHFEFKILFRFYDGFSWNEDLSDGYIHLVFEHALPVGGNSYTGQYFDCTANNQVVSGYDLLDITCSGDLSTSYQYVVPHLIIDNGDKYVWYSNGEWEFYTAYLVSDYDNTPGQSFNSGLFGDMWSPSSDDSNTGGVADWFASLTNLFNFSIPISNTPLGSIFGGFTDSMSCASIPTIASMIHSNETSVCPWFNSTIRSITTPILSLMAVMLTFGFIVRWLGSSSGNNFNDSGGI